MRRQPTRGQRGFTLIEVLVVLAITGMVMASLSVALTRIFDIRERLAPYLDRAELTGLSRDWLRNLFRGLVAERMGGQFTFKGAERRISGMTLAPLGGALGAPAAFRLEFVPLAGGKETIRFTMLDQALPPADLLQLEEGSGRFEFMGADGVWQRQWPPAARPGTAQSPLGQVAGTMPGMPAQWPQLPLLIKLEGLAGGRLIVLTGAPRAASDPLPNVSALFNQNPS